MYMCIFVLPILQLKTIRALLLAIRKFQKQSLACRNVRKEKRLELYASWGEYP